MRRRSILLALLAAAVVDGCACDSVPDTAVTACELSQVVPGAVRTDILFVIDDSQSMSEEQANLQANLNAFISALKASPVANDFQIGVTTTSVAAFDGSLTGARGTLIANVPAGTPAVLTGDRVDLVNEFSQRVVVGTSGSGKEQPLRAMRQALTSPLIDPGNPNEGFLRSGARLAVIFLTDEDDNSETGASVANTNAKTHNDAGDGIDYKRDVEDPIADYLAFLGGPIGGEVRDVVIGAIVPVDASTGLATCGNTGDSWCCGSTSNNVCVANTCGSNSLTIDGLPGSTYCCGQASGTSCTSTCPTAYDKADRFVAFLGGLPAGRKFGGSVCDSSFASTLEEIAGLIISPTLPLEGAPADYRMLVVRLRKAASGNVVPCTVGLTAAADAIYAPPSAGSPATLTFEVAGPADGDVCKLDRGDRIEIDVVCAG